MVYPVNCPFPISPCLDGLPSPAPLVFTPVPSRKSRCSNCEAEMASDHQCKKHLPAPAPLIFTPVCQKVLRCLNCEAEMTADHQCERIEQSTVSSKVPSSADTGQSSAKEMATDHTYDVHRPRRLNIVKFCDTCDTLHPSGSKCPTCVNGSSPT